MWDTTPWTAPRSSFMQPVSGPAAEPCDPPLVCIQINQEYVPLIAGAMSQLVQRTTWLAADESDLQRILANMTWAIELVGTAVQCSQVPAIPGVPTAQQACNLSGYLADILIRTAIEKGLASIQEGYNVLSYGMIIMRFIPGGGGIFGILMGALNGLYTAIEGPAQADFNTALNDPTFFSLEICAIYSAIAADGQVTAANFPTIVANMRAIPYSLTDVRDAVADFVNSLGASGLQGLQPVGALASYDCTHCGTTGPPPLPVGPQPTQIGGDVFLRIVAGAADALVPVLFPRAFPSPPLLTMGVDNEDVIVSYEAVTATGFTARIAAAAPVLLDTSATASYIAQPAGDLNP